MGTPENRAKRLWGSERSNFIEASFTSKIEYMEATVARWIKAGAKDDAYWPEDLKRLKTWHDPDNGRFSWSSDSIANENNKNPVYKNLTKRFWSALEKASDIGAKETPVALKREIAALSAKNVTLVWHVMQLADAVRRLNPDDKVLKRLPHL
jgi:hypothetical protein